MKKIPYGVANFEKLRELDYYFIDKTKYIELLENLDSQYIFFLRPRRFGKSLFISMLEHYYDINKKDKFEELFKDTYIGKNPTPLRNTFPILKLNFSGIPTNGTMKEIENSFNKNIYNTVGDFYSFYHDMTGGMEQFRKDYNETDNATDLLGYFIKLMNRKSLSYYLLIDEYDNFANNILIHHGKGSYQDLTHGGGFLRSFFAAVKNATETRTVERLFVTGVSPLVLSDVTSGFNMGDNISTKIPFNSMIGFTTEEVQEMVDYYISEGAVKKDERAKILETLKINYDNYSFSDKTDEKIYNSDMVLYFFNNYFSAGKIPNELIDPNIRTDFGKLKFMILQDKKLNGNFSILTELLNRQETEMDLVSSFALSDIIEHSKFKSFLYYLGLLTIKEHYYSNKYIMNIPNETVKQMHFEYIREALKGRYDELNINTDLLSSEFDRMAFKGEWTKLMKYILDKFYEASSIRDFVFREEGIKMFLLAYFNITKLYFVESEPEMNHGYADIFLQKNYAVTDLTKYEYLIEVKYRKADETESVETLKEKAAAQLERYAKSQKITCPVKKLIVICSAKEFEFVGEI